MYCPYETGERIPAPDTQLGYIHRITEEPEMVLKGRTVPAALGIAFGIRLRTAPGSAVQGASVVVTRPAAKGMSSVTDRWPGSFGPDFRSNRFKFEFEDEIVLGTWSFEIRSAQDTVLFRQEFDVVPAYLVPNVLETCFGSQMVS